MLPALASASALISRGWAGSPASPNARGSTVSPARRFRARVSLAASVADTGMGARVSRDGGTVAGNGVTGAETGAAGAVVSLGLAGGGGAIAPEGFAGRADGMAAPAMDMALDS